MSNTTNFPFAEISGTPYEIGFQHGSIFKDKIRNSIDCYRKMFVDYSDLEWDRAKVLSRSFIDMIRDYNPDYIEEIRGVVEGSGFDFEDILALNCRSELVFAGKQMDETTGNCTSIGINSDAGKDGDAFIGHNWDWKTSQRGSMVMMRITQTNGRPTIFMITEAGIIGKTGVNSAGIALVLNAMSTDAPPAGLPLHIAMRGILDSPNLADAIAAATKKNLGCCANFMIAHKNGECIDIEVENEDFDVLYPTNGVLVHTNHFISLRLPRYPRKDTMKYASGHSFIRLGRADRLIRKKAPGVCEQDIMDVLRDHGEFPNGICRHDDPTKPVGKQMSSVFSIVVNVTKGKIWFAKGNPCDTPYEEYSV